MEVKDYVEYQSLFCELKKRLGLYCLRVYDNDNLLPYYLYILRHITSIFVIEDLSNPESLERLIEMYDRGQDQITTGKLEEMYQEYEVEDESKKESWSDVLWSDAWVEVMKTIYMTALSTYPELFATRESDCHCSCYSLDEEGYVLPVKSPLGSKNCGCK